MKSSNGLNNGDPWGTSHELNPVCKLRHCQNLKFALNDLALWAVALSHPANLTKNNNSDGFLWRLSGQGEGVNVP